MLTLNSKALAYLKGLKTKEEIEIFLEGLGMAQDTGTTLESIVKNRATLVAPPGMPVFASIPDAKPDRETRHMLNRGLQGDILRLLFTGPCSFKTLKAELSYPQAALKASLRQLVTRALVTELKSGSGIDVYSLTPEGTVKAKYFAEHPNAKLWHKETK